MIVNKDIYEYLLKFVDDQTAINMLSVNKKFCTETQFEKLMKIKYPFLMENKMLDETWKQLFIRMTYYIRKLKEEYDIPYVPVESYNPYYHYIYNVDNEIGAYDWCITWAAYGGCLDIIKSVEEKLSLTKIPNNSEILFEKCMLNAASGGHISVVKYMMEKGAKNFNQTMKTAAHGGHIDVIKLMIDKGADHFDDALFQAAGNGKLETVKFLINQGANDFSSAIVYATRGKELHVIKFLSKFLDPNNIDLRHAIELAKCEGYTEIYEYLISFYL